MRTPTTLKNLCRRHTKGHPEEGIGLIEALVASFVMIMAVLAGSQILITGFRIAAESRAKDQAIIITNETLERSRAFGCGLSVGIEPVTVVEDRNSKCFDANGATSFETVVNGITYTTEVSYRWTVLNPDQAPLPTCETRAGGETPNALERQVRTSWLINGRTETHEANFIESLPPNSIDFNSPERTNIIINTAPGALVELNTHTSSPELNVRRHADASGCVWFPFLTPSASYQFKVGADTNRDGNFDSPPTAYSTTGPHQRQHVCTHTFGGGGGFNGCRDFSS